MTTCDFKQQNVAVNDGSALISLDEPTDVLFITVFLNKKPLIKIKIKKKKIS